MSLLTSEDNKDKNSQLKVQATIVNIVVTATGVLLSAWAIETQWQFLAIYFFTFAFSFLLVFL